MADYTRAFRLSLLGMLVKEGGYSNNPADRGGETFCGISRRYHPDWPGWPVIDATPAAERDKLTNDPDMGQVVAAFYHAEYWQPLRLDEIRSEAVASELFDSAVNVGKGRAARWLQHAVNLLSSRQIAEDGAVGPVTIAAANAVIKDYGGRPLLTTLNGLQFEHYHRLVEADPSQRVFFRGWLSRVWVRK